MENFMIKITSLAQERLKDFLTQNKATPNVRVFLPTSGCGGDGQHLSLTVDDPNDQDFSLTTGDITFSINHLLLDLTGAITIDFKDDGFDSGFVIDHQKILPPVDSDCGGCSGCC
jgi:Fe-S cluster assembly iron-binding protein IscA